MILSFATTLAAKERLAQLGAELLLALEKLEPCPPELEAELRAYQAAKLEFARLRDASNRAIGRSRW